MGQIVKKKKKGRPAKADLSARDQETPERDLRRSLRRRNVKYVFDLDDYFDEDELFTDDEDQRRREKKLKLLLKLHSGDEPESTSRERHAPCTSASSADEDGKPLKGTSEWERDITVDMEKCAVCRERNCLGK